MDPCMLASVTLLARREGWQPPRAKHPRPRRLVVARLRLADALRSIAARIEPAPRCEPMLPATAR